MVTSTSLTDDSTDADTDGSMQVPPFYGSDATQPKYDAEIARYDDAPDECTISPTATEGEERLTTWLSAQDGSYVDLDGMR
ncbi:DUF7511 domain-containing protein [Halogranum rubrum]|nr:hypothetical protein [Halogranum salarium]